MKTTLKNFKLKSAAHLTKNQISIILLLFFSALAIANCRRKDDDPILPPPVIYPMETGIVQKLAVGKSFSKITGEHEMGVKFKSTYKGKITKISVNTSSTGNLDVTLWRVSDKSKIGIYTINSTSATVYTNSDQSIPIEANTEYLISVHSPKYLYYNAANPILPYTNGNLTLIEYYYNSDTSHNFPVTTLTAESKTMFGLVDFDFQRVD